MASDIQAREIFVTVRQEPPAEQQTSLERLCSGDLALLNAVKEMLLEDQRAENPELLVRRDDGSNARIDKYEILERIGGGGFGDVFLGRDTVIKRQVALKLCNSADEDLKKRFGREVKIIGGLRHPNITTLHDSGSYGEVPYLVQEYLPGEDLEQQIRLGRPTPPQRRLDYLIQIARGLAYAHNHGVVHRDIKPSNVRLTDDGMVKIMDFGVARLIGAQTRLTATGMRVGTMCYMAPEQLRGEQVDARADIFSFGVLAFELLTHQHPFPAESSHAMIYQVLESEPLRLKSLWRDCPKALERCIDKCLEKNVKRRTPNMDMVVAELEAVEISPHASAVTGGRSSLETMATVSLPVGEVARRRRRSRRLNKTLIGGLAAVAVVVLAGLLFFMANRGDAPTGTERISPEPTPPALAEAAPPEAAPPEAAPPEASPPPETVPAPATISEPAPPAPTSPAATPPPSPARPETPTPASNETAVAGPGRATEPSVDQPVVEQGTVELPPPPPAVPAPPPTVPAPARPEAPVETASPIEAAPPPAPPKPAPRGPLLINALPWARVAKIQDADGTVHVPAAGSSYTPMGVRLPEGSYTITLIHPGHGERHCQAEVTEAGAARCFIPMVGLKAADFFARADLGAPGGGVRRPPPRPPGGRPPVRREAMQPRWMKKAAQKYFDGDYVAVYDEMKAGKASDRSTVFFARLFLGGAQHALFLLGGGVEKELRDSAVENLRQCRQEFPSFVPHPDFFSPRFIEFYSVEAMP